MCLKQYVELLIKEGLETAISCPDAACPKQGHLQEDEIECMVAAEIMQRYKKLQFEREVLLDPCRTWCPASACQAVCQLQEMGLRTPQLVQCKACDMEFCSACKASWHPGQGCPESLPTTFLPGETSSAFKLEEDDAPIKRCPKCKVYIERDEGCAQMMCKNCKHAFCWYCLESLDDDFLLIHYDKGPCRNKLGHSRASVIWHRTQHGCREPFALFLVLARKAAVVRHMEGALAPHWIHLFAEDVSTDGRVFSSLTLPSLLSRGSSGPPHSEGEAHF
uniref:E3 ubiquitin-protein ligase RNF144A isoform X3 n=1 Tax=Halichoerus grypus TaxID=9711 RepID=UPI001659F2FA|nr:E3 ubiquitin-protein ligase RNF144A isoform X3 [Halichoerus grypus]